jgi:hypothetical protein
MQNTPILLNSCARATTAGEARFRIDAPIAPSRAARVVALDEGAEPIVRRAAALPWAVARFFLWGTQTLPATSTNDLADIILRSVDGSEAWLSEVLAGADVAMMVATANDGAAMASAIGHACALRGIVIDDRGDASAAVAALRPYARVLVVTHDEQDVTEVLTALRA